MIKKIFCILFLAFQTCALRAQVWNAVGGGINVQSGVEIDAIYNFNDSLYVGGGFDTIGGLYASNLGKWDGANWSNIGNTLGQVYSFQNHNNELYAGGHFISINGNTYNRKVSKYNGIGWDSVGGSALSNRVNCLASYQGNLYAGGLFSGTSNPNMKRIAYWDGSQWNALGTGVSGSVTEVFCIAVYHNELYIGGEFNTANGLPANYIVKWNGSSFSTVGGGTDATVFAMIVDSVNDRLICGGNFYHAGPVTTPYNVATWNGTNWSTLGSGTLGMHDLGVRSFAFYRDKLFETGANEGLNNFSDSLHFIAMWDGTDWQPLDKGLNCPGLTLEVYKDELYVGGCFDMAGDSVAHKIARWYMPPVGVEELKNKEEEIIVFPNPFNDTFKVQSSKYKVKRYEVIYNNGNKIFDKIFPQPTKVFSMNLSGYTNGVYFLKVFTDKGSVVKKIVKE